MIEKQEGNTITVCKNKISPSVLNVLLKKKQAKVDVFGIIVMNWLSIRNKFTRCWVYISVTRSK